MEITKSNMPKFMRGRCIALDIETTGMSFQRDSIIELGVVEYQDGEPVLEHSRLFSGGMSPAYLVNHVHQIPDEIRMNEPSFTDKAEDIADYLSGALLIGHNLEAFDLPFINFKLKSKGWSISDYRTFDTLKWARKVETHEKNNLEWLCKHYNLPYGGHKAMGDAKSCMLLLPILAQILKIEEL